MSTKIKLSKKALIIIILCAALIVVLLVTSLITALIADNDRLRYREITDELIAELDAGNTNPQYAFLSQYKGTYAVIDIKDTYRGGIFAKSKVVVPSKYRGKNVTSIISLQSLQKAKELVISEGIINIANSAFAQGKFSTVTLPSTVTNIGTYAFQNCTNLKDAQLPENLTFISAGLFDGCSALETVEFSTKLESVGTNAFNGCRNLTSFISENGAKYLGTATNKHYVLVEKENENIETCTINEETVIISGRAFYGCSKLQSITIPNNVTIIGTSAFGNCTALTNITLGSGLTEIPENAFNGCTDLETITLPDNIKTIQESAFSGCKKLSQVTLGKGLSRLYGSIFAYCENLKAINYTGTVAQWDEINKRESGTSSWFRRANALVTITCSDGTYTLQDGTWVK